MVNEIIILDSRNLNDKPSQVGATPEGLSAVTTDHFFVVVSHS